MVFSEYPQAVLAVVLLLDDIVVLADAEPVAAVASLPFNNSNVASPVCKFVVILFILYVKSCICTSSANVNCDKNFNGNLAFIFVILSLYLNTFTIYDL